MKAKFTFRIFLIGILSAIVCACATYPRSGTPAVAGSWANSLGTVWTLNTNGTFDVDLNHNGKRDAWGNYTVEGNTITLNGTGGVAPKGCKGKGVYRFARGSDTLRFTLVHDDCKVRVKNVMLVWHQK